MDNRIVDLHVHSTESDGTFTPTEVIAEAKKAGLSAIALTDHDTATGIRKAMGAAKEAGIELIPGIELSTAYTFPGKKQEKEIHIVGLYINPDDPELLKMTAEFRECRDKRNEKMIAALQEEGFPITMEALLAANPDSVITRANMNMDGSNPFPKPSTNTSAMAAAAMSDVLKYLPWKPFPLSKEPEGLPSLHTRCFIIWV